MTDQADQPPSTMDESVTLTAADGVTLDADLRTPVSPTAAAVVCHPHPLYGGNRHNNVVAALYDQFTSGGTTGAVAACVRFDFRGVGRSDGGHEGGVGERLDIEAAVDEMAERFPGLPIILAGYSFGADVALSVTHPAIAAWLAVAPPLRIIETSEMGAGSDPRPKRLATGIGDEFRGPAEVRSITAGWPDCRVTEIPGADHFFSVGLDQVRSVAAELLAQLTG